MLNIDEIQNGIVIDHICKGDSPSEIRAHMRLISSVLGIDEGRGGEWISRGADGQYKGIIFRPGDYELGLSDGVVEQIIRRDSFLFNAG